MPSVVFSKTCQQGEMRRAVQWRTARRSTDHQRAVKIVQNALVFQRRLNTKPSTPKKQPSASRISHNFVAGFEIAAKRTEEHTGKTFITIFSHFQCAVKQRRSGGTDRKNRQAAYKPQMFR